MKKIFLFLSAMFLLVACGGNAEKITYETAIKIIPEKIEMKDFLKENEDRLEYLYDIKKEDVKNFTLYAAKTNILANEILILEAHQKEDIPALKEKVEKRLDVLEKDFESYIPKQADLVKNRKLWTQDNLLVLVVAEDVSNLDGNF